MAVTAVAEACFSRQPWLPQPQGFPLGTTVTWPSSPAIPTKPRITRPPQMIPPPIPVPSVSSTRSSTSRPAPIHFSPNAAALASFSRITKDTSRLVVSSFTGQNSRYGRVLDVVTSPFFVAVYPSQPALITVHLPDPKQLA